MNSLIAANAFGNSCQSRGKDASAPVSLAKSMDGFLAAVSQMRNTIMVPSVLKDISYEEVAGQSAPKAPLGHPGSDSDQVVPADGEKSTTVMPPVENPDLLLCYKMVDAVSNDLVSGPVPKSSEDDDDIPDEDRFVGFFRGQVQGFMNAIHQMTEMANLLTRKYNESLTGESST